MSKIITADVRRWLPENLKGTERMPSAFVSLPDADEMGWQIEVWRPWFRSAIAQAMTYTAPNGYTFFYQTDRKAHGELYSKAQLVLAVAEELGYRVISHKIACTVKPGGVNLYRPGFTHLICVSKLGSSGRATPDVFEAGRKIYDNATGENACKSALDFLQAKGVVECFDLYCGRGSFIYHALRDYDMEVTAIDIDPDQTNLADQLIHSIQTTFL